MKRKSILGCMAGGLLIATPLLAEHQAGYTSTEEWSSDEVSSSPCGDSHVVVSEYYQPTRESHRARSTRHPGYVAYGMNGATNYTYSRSGDEIVQENEIIEFTLRGPIESIRTIESNRDGREVTVITINDPDRGISTVNLGPQKKFSSLNLKESDRLTVRVRSDRKDAAGRLVASSVEFNNRKIVLNSDLDSDRVAMGETREFKGEIVSTRTEMVGSTRHTIVKLRGENDRVDVIDLGPEQELRSLNLAEGQRITLQARQGRFDGRTRLFANRLETNDRTIDIDRSSQPRLQGQPVSPGDSDRAGSQKDNSTNKERESEDQANDEDRSE